MSRLRSDCGSSVNKRQRKTKSFEGFRFKMTTTRPSFLEAVLTNAGQVEMFELKERIVDVTQKVSQLKLRVHDQMKSKYIDFHPLLKKTKGFFDKAVKTSDEINTLFNRIEFQTKCDLADSTGELRSLRASLKESSAVLSVTTELLQLDGIMKDVDNSCEKRKFFDAAKSLQSLRDLMKNCSKDTKQLDIYKSMSKEVKALFSMFCSGNAEKLDSFITWEKTEIANNIVRSTVKINVSNFSEMQEIAQALHLLDELDPWMKKLRQFLLRSILLPLITSEASIKFAGDSEASMEVSVKLNSRKPPFSVILENLTKCFEFVHGELDMQLDNNNTFISLLGSGASEEFSENLIKNCLKETVPSSSTEIQNIPLIQERTAAFNNYMVGIGFFAEENRSLLDYVENFDALCANKACESYLQMARDIMKEDLQDMMEVGPQIPSIPLNGTLDSTGLTDSTGSNQDSFSNVNIKPETELNPHLFQFPICCVSKSTMKILDLVGAILEETTRSPRQGVSPQFYLTTTKSIFELYIAVVPNIHKKFLNTIPQQVALFHNNCMYLAHRLTILGFEIEASFRSVLEPDVVITFVDLVQCLRQLGTSTYLQQMQQQKKQMLDTVKESGLVTLGENSQFSPDTERSLRQCVRQLELLQAVWQNVLPHDVYSKSIGVLANAFIEELIVRVSSVEDIPANTAVQLTSLFKMVQERIPKLFKDGNKITIHVKRWQKFQELIGILGASLRDIEERWAEGKGPLAKEFTMDQVKQLIRALFQNTNRRAEVLAKIR